MKKLLVGLNTVYPTSMIIPVILDVFDDYNEDSDRAHNYASLRGVAYMHAKSRFCDESIINMFDPRVTSVIQVTELRTFTEDLYVSYEFDGRYLAILVTAPNGYDALKDGETKFERLRGVICKKLKSNAKTSKYNDLRENDINIIGIIESSNSSNIESDFDKYNSEDSNNDFEYRLKECESMIKVFCSVFDMLDEYRRIVLVLILSQYLESKSGSIGKAVVTEDIKYNDSLSRVLKVRDAICSTYGTKEYKDLFSDIWDNGHMKYVLEYNGFI